MVDRKQRDILADMIHELIIGSISNYEFENSIYQYGMRPLASPDQWQDAAIGPLLERAWCLYGDSYEYHFAGANSLSRKDRAEVLRWILFLRSDSEYQWTPFRFINPALVSSSGCVLSLLTLGFWPRVESQRLFAEWSQFGEFAVWPFSTRSAYDQVYADFCPLKRIRAV